MNTLAKHLVDWSFRRGGAVETISETRIKKQGYRVAEVRADLAAEADTFDGRVYRGEDWAAEVTPD